MFRDVIFLFFYINLVYCTNNGCFEKHISPLNDENYTIFERNISNIRGKGFDLIPESGTLQNNGQTVIIKYLYKNTKAILQGGPYGDDKYKFEFMYFNWLKENHTTTGAFPIELHLLFANRKYQTYENAVTQNFGLTVLSFRYAKKDKNFQDYSGTDDIYESLKNVQKPNTEITLHYPDTFLKPLYALTDIRDEYFMYQGRLLSTLHPCSADVIWIEFPNMIQINKAELESFQNLLAADMKPMMAKFHETIAPNGPIYRKVDLYKYKGMPLPAFEGFNPIAIENSAFRSEEIFVMLRVFITIFGIFIGFFK